MKEDYKDTFDNIQRRICKMDSEISDLQTAIYLISKDMITVNTLNRKSLNALLRIEQGV